MPHFLCYSFEQYRLLVKILIIGLIVSAGYTYSVLFFTPKKVDYTLSKTDCFSNSVLLPSLTTPVNSNGFDVYTEPTFRVGSKVMYSGKTCIMPTAAPLSATKAQLKLSAFGVAALSQQITVESAGASKVTTLTNLTTLVPSTSSLQFSLSKTDQEVFGYQLQSEGKSSNCTFSSTVTLNCSLQPLALKQGATHSFLLVRLYKNAPVQTVVASSISTFEPLVVASSSISANQLVYTVPTAIVLNFNKVVGTLGEVTLQQVVSTGNAMMPVTVVNSGTQVTVQLVTPLLRDASYELRLNAASGTDKSTLLDPYVLNFTTSGGPKVIATNIPSYKASTKPAVTVSFDVNLLPKQKLASFITLTSGGVTVPSTVTASGNSVTVTSTGDLGRCAAFSVSVAVGLVNEYGVGGGTAWHADSRTVCQQVLTIGYSVLGAAINAYSFGTGTSSVLYVGGLHGNESSSVTTLQSFTDDMERLAPSLPANRRVVIVPNTNPDAYAAKARLNAHGIDLNRNFDANNWVTDVYIPISTLLKGGGGTAPLSEPETGALASFIKQLNPWAVMTYHANARVVVSNEYGNANALGDLYAGKAGYKSLTNSASDAVFSYPTTGELEDWLHDKQGIPTLLVELGTMTSNEYKTQKSAMWALATY